MIIAGILWRRVQERGRWPLGNCGIRHWWCQKLCCFTDFTRNIITFRCGPWKIDCIDVDPNWTKPNLILEHRMNNIYCYWSKYVHCIYWKWIPYIHTLPSCLKEVVAESAPYKNLYSLFDSFDRFFKGSSVIYLIYKNRIFCSCL